MTALSCAVVVVAYRSGPHIRSCLQPCLADAAVAQIVVVDNSGDNSTADHVHALASDDARVKYVDPGRNLGFAAGCNLGVTLAQPTPYVAFLNPDVTPHRTFSNLIELLQRNGAAVAAARLSAADGTADANAPVNARQTATAFRELRKACLGTRLDRLTLPARAEVRVDQVDGALMVMRRKDFLGLGGFDERFELYYEDVDLCRRAAGIGGCIFDTTSWGTHVGGASFRSASAMSYCLLRISRARHARKYRLGRSPSLYILLLGALELVSRTVTRQPEGTRTRVRSLRLQVRELIHPGSVRLLARPQGSATP